MPRQKLTWVLGNGRENITNSSFNMDLETSLVVQWLRVCLSVQVKWVQSRYLELDPMCHVATKAVCCKEPQRQANKTQKASLMKNQDISLPSRVKYPRYREQMNRNTSFGASWVYLYRLH